MTNDSISRSRLFVFFLALAHSFLLLICVFFFWFCFDVERIKPATSTWLTRTDPI